MSSYLVGASRTFLLVVSLDTESEMRRWDGTISLKHGTRFWSEMISCWVYKDLNTIFIMKRNDWSTNLNSNAYQQWDDFLLGILRPQHYFQYEKEWMVSWENEGCYWVRKDGTHFFAGYSVNERIKDWYYRTSAVAQQSRQSSWKRWFLLERWRWKSIFIMEVNKDMKAVEVTREGASSTFLLDISIRQEINVCMVPFFPIGWHNLLMCNFVQDWRMKRFVVALEVYIYIRIGQKCTPSNLYICFFITKVILMNQETDDRWHLSREGRYTLFRWIFGHMDWIKSTTRHKRWKLISPHAHLRPQL